MSSKIILKAEALDGYLTEKDQEYLAQMDVLYKRAMESFSLLSAGGFSSSSLPTCAPCTAVTAPAVVLPVKKTTNLHQRE